jgi:hypothetical protein
VLGIAELVGPEVAGGVVLDRGAGRERDVGAIGHGVQLSGNLGALLRE